MLKNWIFAQKVNICSKIQFLLKNPFFAQTSNFCSKIALLLKNLNFPLCLLYEASGDNKLRDASGTEELNEQHEAVSFWSCDNSSTRIHWKSGVGQIDFTSGVLSQSLKYFAVHRKLDMVKRYFLYFLTIFITTLWLPKLRCLKGNFDFWPTFWFVVKISIAGNKFEFLAKILIFVKISIVGNNFDFWPNFWFVAKISICGQNFDFWSKFWFSSKCWLLTITSIFGQNFDFCRRFLCSQNVNLYPTFPFVSKNINILPWLTSAYYFKLSFLHPRRYLVVSQTFGHLRSNLLELRFVRYQLQSRRDRPR